VVGQNVGKETTGASEREKRRDGSFFLRAGLRAASAPCSRSKLEASSQKLPVPVESAWSWIILPKGIFIGRECMQKRGHRHKGTAPADLALTQLREWTHDFVSAASDSQLEQTPRNRLPNFPLSAAFITPFFLFLSSPFFPFPSFSFFLFFSFLFFFSFFFPPLFLFSFFSSLPFSPFLFLILSFLIFFYFFLLFSSFLFFLSLCVKPPSRKSIRVNILY